LVAEGRAGKGLKEDLADGVDVAEEQHARARGVDVAGKQIGRAKYPSRQRDNMGKTVVGPEGEVGRVTQAKVRQGVGGVDVQRAVGEGMDEADEASVVPRKRERGLRSSPKCSRW
jgi:hypothetical protein